MSYTINKTNGTIFAVVEDGTVDSTSSITLVGKNYAGYGELHGENFLHLLENSANDTEPSNPLAGQLWYDTDNSLLKIYTGSQFKVISSATAASSAPTGTTTGDLWYDTAENQLKVYNGSGWTVVGPAYSTTTGTSGAIVETVLDNAAGSHIVVKLYTGGTLVGIISKDATFTPASAITGFATIGPGLNLSTTVANAVFKGTATNSQLLDNLDSADFMRSTANTNTTGTLAILNDTGAVVGVDSDLKLSISGTQALITNQTTNNDIVIKVAPSGSLTTAVTVHGANANVSIATNLTIAGSLTVSGSISGTATNVSGVVAVANGGTGVTSSTGTGSTVLSASPTLSGTPLAPTASAGTNTTQIATTAFVTTAVSSVSGTLGTMSTQNANAIAVTGGSLANVSISGTANISAGTINGLTITTLGTNGTGTRTVSASAPSGGANGDIWYQI